MAKYIFMDTWGKSRIYRFISQCKIEEGMNTQDINENLADNKFGDPPTDIYFNALQSDPMLGHTLFVDIDWSGPVD